MGVTGPTKAERDAARQQVRRERRITFYRNRIRDARSSRERLAQACDFAKAVGDDLDDTGRDQLAGLIAKLADERNRA
jgi:hypothetical protein